MKIKGSYFWYGLLISLCLGFMGKALWTHLIGVKEYIVNTIFFFSSTYVLVSFLWNLFDFQLGFEFWDNTSYGKATKWGIFRFSPVHFLIFVVVVSFILLVLNPILTIGKWCDKYLSVGDV